jgi:nucleoside-diphosphate-sugar epimerase
VTEPNRLPAWPAPSPLPSRVESEELLDDLLSRPTAADVAFVGGLDGDVTVLGAGGKMGPTLARRLKRASSVSGGRVAVRAVSRFSNPETASSLSAEGIEVVNCDLLDPSAVQALPDCANVFFLAGMKFGATGNPALTWALNTAVPALVARRFARSRLVAFSTGNVYPLVEPARGGCTERDPTAPVGEYAQSCLGRERIFEHYSRSLGTRGLLFRLFYAVDLRYGTLVDVARRVYLGEAVDLSVPCFNAIWQGDALSYAIRSLGLVESPPRVLNVTGAEIVPVRAAAEEFGRRFGRTPSFRGQEGRLALLGDASLCHSLLGPPEVSREQLTEWVADWVERGGRSLGKPTGFEKADGRF